MAVEFKIEVENKPGELARVGETLGMADVNIEAIIAHSTNDRGIIQLVTDNSKKAARAFEEAGIGYATREVLVVNVLDEPGTLGDVARVMSEANINIDAAYATYDGKMILGVDDMKGALQVAGGMAVMDYQ